MKYDIFISYSRKDIKLVKAFHDELVKLGYCVWMDVDGIESSDIFKVKIVSAIKESQVFLFFSSQNSNGSEWTVKEVDLAVHLKKVIIPVKLDGTDYHDSLLFDLLGIDYIACTNPNDFKNAISRLSRTLIMKLSKELATTESPVANPVVKEKKDVDLRKNNYVDPWYRRQIFGIVTIVLVFGIALCGVISKKTTKGKSESIAFYEKLNMKENSNIEDVELREAVFYYDKGLDAYLRQDYLTSVRMLRPSAEYGYARAQCLLGFCYAKGTGVELSFEKAVKWYTLAAEQGDAEAQNKLAWCYQFGEGIEQSYAKAFEWNMKAANQGYSISQNNVAAFYFYGWGVDQSYEKAVKWYILAAEKEEPQALYHLGVCYEYGFGVQQSISTALKYYQRAANKGVVLAQEELSRLSMYI